MPPRVLVCTLAALALSCASGGAPRPPRPGAAPANDAASAALERGRIALTERRLADAERAYAEAARLAPSDPRAHLGLARARLSEARFLEALGDAGRAVELGGTAEALVLRGRILGNLRRFDAAALDLERTGELDPANGEAWVLLAAVDVNRGDDVEAAWAFARAAEALGGDHAFERMWTSLLAMPPDPVQPQEAHDRCLRGRAAQLAGRWEEALREQSAGLRYTRTYYWCGAGIAESTRQLGDPARAETIYRGVVESFPEGQRALRADAQGRLAALLLELKRPPSESVALAREALAVRGERAALLDTLGRACDALGDVACARDAYERALRRPHLPEAMRAHAEARVRALPRAAAAR